MNVYGYELKEKTVSTTINYGVYIQYFLMIGDIYLLIT